MAMIEVPNLLNIAQAFTQGQRDRADIERGRMEQEFTRRKMEDAEELRTARKEAQGLYAGGDVRAARSRAIAGGDFDFAETLNKLRQEQTSELPTVINMLKAAKRNPQAYQSIRAQAIQFGIPGAEQSPDVYDPAWIDQQIMTMEAFASPQGQEALSAAGKIAADMGYRPGTPEYTAKVTEIWQTEATKFYPLTEGGGLAGVAPGRSAQLVIAPNPGGYTPGAPAGGGGMPRVSSPEEAMRLPPGTPFLMPDGRIGTVPGGPTPRASGNFPGY